MGFEQSLGQDGNKGQVRSLGSWWEGIENAGEARFSQYASWLKTAENLVGQAKTDMDCVACVLEEVDAATLEDAEIEEVCGIAITATAEFPPAELVVDVGCLIAAVVKTGAEVYEKCQICIYHI